MKAQDARTKKERPTSYIMAKLLFKKRVYGVQWLFAEVVGITTNVPSEKNLAEKIDRAKPKIRVAQAFTDAVSSKLSQ